MPLQDLDGELKVLEERQGLEVGVQKSSSFRGSSSREVMRTGSSIPMLSRPLNRSALARQSSETRSACLEHLDTIGEDDLGALADEVRPLSTSLRAESAVLCPAPASGAWARSAAVIPGICMSCLCSAPISRERHLSEEISFEVMCRRLWIASSAAGR